MNFNFGEIKVFTDHPELVYGATAIVSNKKVDKELINPFTKKCIQIIDLGENKDRFFIPAHNQKDFKTASKLNLHINQATAPYFKNYIKFEVKTEIRNSVIALIKHSICDKFLCLDAKNKDCKSFIMGGIEFDETPQDAANLQSETEQKKFILAFREVIRLITTLKTFEEFDFDESLIGISEL